MALTDVQIRNTKPGGKQYKLTDGGGLYLLITSKGGKWWRFDYRFAGRRKTLSLGTYPDVSLKEACDRRDEARKLVGNSVDPGEVRKAEKAAKAGAESFEAVAREWLAKFSSKWVDSHTSKIEDWSFGMVGNDGYLKSFTQKKLADTLKVRYDSPIINTFDAHSFGGQNAIGATYTGTANSVRETSFILQTVRGSKRYTFGCSALADDFPNRYLLFQRIADTFKFTRLSVANEAMLFNKLVMQG